MFPSVEINLLCRSESDMRHVAEMFLQSSRGAELGPSVFRLQHAESNGVVVRDVLAALSTLTTRHASEDGLRSLVVADLVVPSEGASQEPTSGGDRSEEDAKRARLDDDSDEVIDASISTDDGQTLCPLADLDEQLRSMYAALAPGSILLVATQGDLSTLKQVASQKLR